MYLLREHLNLQVRELVPNKQLQLTLPNCLVCSLLMFLYLRLTVFFLAMSLHTERISSYFKYGISSEHS